MRSSVARAGARRGRDEEGFTLIEVLMAAVVLVVGLIGLFGLLDVSVRATAATRTREDATNLARQIVEDARSIPYAQVSPTSITSQLRESSGLTGTSTEAGWQIVRRGITFTVTASECAIDDPKNGYGSGKKNGTFCSESETEGTTDPQPANLKRITVNVKWVTRGRTSNVEAIATLTAAGGAVGLSASELKLASPAVGKPTEPVVTKEPLSKELTFQVTAPKGTEAMVWLLEGVKQATAPTLETGTTWTFSWKISGLSDGTYTVGAQATDAEGVKGPPVSIPVTLIRNVPAAPKGIAGGFNKVNVKGASTKVVELEWSANAERNVIGYRVYNAVEKKKCARAPRRSV